MTNLQIKELIEKLKDKSVTFDSGLTHEETLQIQDKFGFRFPPDLKHFLQTALPTSEGFYDWRRSLKSEFVADNIRIQLRWPLEGMLFDIEKSNFWVEDWGQKPTSTKEQFNVAENYFKTYPRLVPIYSHRYIPSEPNTNDNPVFSVYQMDIIYYGYNLATYLANEFSFSLSDNFEIIEEPKHEIEFWTWCVEINGKLLSD